MADGSDIEARTKMAIAATLGGLAWGNSWVGLAHAMGHALNAVFHQPHGRCVGTYLPYTIEFSARGAGTRYRDIAALLHLPAADELSAGEAVACSHTAICCAESGSLQPWRRWASKRRNTRPPWSGCATSARTIWRCPRRSASHLTRKCSALYRYAYAGHRVDF